MKDSGVTLYRLSHVNRQINPEDWVRANVELAETAEYARDHPGEFGKALINWEDLSAGRYSEWMGNFGPDAVLATVTWGAGAAVTGSTRVVRAATTRPELPDLDVNSPTTRPGPRSGGDPVEGLLKGLDADAREKIPLSSPGVRQALEGMVRDSSAGTRGNTPRSGQFELNRTAGHVSEIRALLDLARRPDVARVIPVPGASGGRTPDFIVEYKSGETARVEVKTVTGVSGRPKVQRDANGRPSNYQPRGLGRAEAPSPDDIKAAIRAKVAGARTQFNEPFDDLAEGGVLSLHLRGPADAGKAAADEAINAEAVRGKLAGAKVRVEVNLTDHSVVHYTVKRDGTVDIRRVAAP